MSIKRSKKPMEHEIFHTESYFSVSSDELAKLAALTREFGTIEEMRIADLIANSLPQSRYAKDLHWDYLCKLTAAYNVGYILGKRAERTRRRNSGKSQEVATV